MNENISFILFQSLCKPLILRGVKSHRPIMRHSFRVDFDFSHFLKPILYFQGLTRLIDLCGDGTFRLQYTKAKKSVLPCSNIWQLQQKLGIPGAIQFVNLYSYMWSVFTLSYDSLVSVKYFISRLGSLVEVLSS